MRFLTILTTPLISEKRSTAYSCAFGVWLLVAIYCILHDQYIVRIAPEHFTVYHAPIWGLSKPTAIAAAWAFKASLVPGLGLGVAATFIARHGSLPRLPVRSVFLGAGVVIILTEITAASVGVWTQLTGRRLLPESWIPRDSKALLVTQTIQLTAYLSAALYSTLWLVWICRWRLRRANPGRPNPQDGSGA